MGLKNTLDSYGLISKNLHWILAVLLLLNFSLGFVMGELEKGPLRSSLFHFHKSMGILLLGLIILRLLWRVINTAPTSLSNNKLIKRTSKFIHYSFYLILLIVTFSGWIYSTARAGPVDVFGLFYMPAIVEKNDIIGQIAKDIHIYSVYIFISFLVIHIFASIYHHFFLKDKTLKRMWY